MSNNLPRILIVGSLPLSNSNQSRAMITYLKNWENDTDKIAQIYFSNVEPSFDFVKNFYKITDSMVLNARKHCKKCEGIVIDETYQVPESINKQSGGKSIKKTPFVHMCRKWLWNKRTWYTKKLNEFVDEFKPDIVYLAFSNDFCILNVAQTIAEERNLPIITVIGDDYYFLKEPRKHFFGHIYLNKYRRRVNKLFNYKTGILFNSEKILKKYQEKFNNRSAVINISSELKFSDRTSETIRHLAYIGNVELGRDEALIEVGKALAGKDVALHIYGSANEEQIAKFNEVTNISFEGFKSYQEIVEVISNSDGLVIVESFEKKNIEKTYYSLSTKAADYLMSGKPIFAYGPIEAGVIEYLKDTKVAFVSTKKENLLSDLEEYLRDFNKDGRLQSQHEIAMKNHNSQSNSNIFKEMVEELLK